MSSSEEFEMEEVQVPQPAQNMPAEEIDPDRTASTLESLNHQNTADDDDDDQDEWEEVDASVQPTTSQQPQPGLQITLDNAAVKRPEKKDSKCVVAITLSVRLRLQLSSQLFTDPGKLALLPKSAPLDWLPIRFTLSL